VAAEFAACTRTPPKGCAASTESKQLIWRLVASSSESAEAEQALVATADQVLVLREDLLADLDERTRRQLERLRKSEVDWARLHREYAEKETELRDKHTEYEKLKVERDGLLRAVAAQQACDRDLLARLSAVSEAGALDRVRALLSDVQTTLDQVETALGDALVRYDQFVEQNRKVLPW